MIGHLRVRLQGRTALASLSRICSAIQASANTSGQGHLVQIGASCPLASSYGEANHANNAMGLRAGRLLRSEAPVPSDPGAPPEPPQAAAPAPVEVDDERCIRT